MKTQKIQFKFTKINGNKEFEKIISFESYFEAVKYEKINFRNSEIYSTVYIDNEQPYLIESFFNPLTNSWEEIETLKSKLERDIINYLTELDYTENIVDIYSIHNLKSFSQAQSLLNSRLTFLDREMPFLLTNQEELI